MYREQRETADWTNSCAMVETKKFEKEIEDIKILNATSLSSHSIFLYNLPVLLDQP